MTRSTIAVLAVAAFALTGCTQPSPGSPAPGSSSSGGQYTSASSPSGSATTRSAAGGSLQSVDPCTWLTSGELAQLGLPAGKKQSIGGSRGCGWPAAPDGYALQIAIWDTQGIKEIATQGGRLSNQPVGKHDGKRLEEPASATGGCMITVGVTSSSRVDVVVTEVDLDTAKACGVATQIATKIESKL